MVFLLMILYVRVAEDNASVLKKLVMVVMHLQYSTMQQVSYDAVATGVAMAPCEAATK